MTTARPLATVILALAALAAAGCGSGSSSTSSIGLSSPASTPSTTDTATAPTTTAATAPINPVLAHKPVVVVPKGPAPTHLVVKDLVTGTGPAAKAGHTVSVRYVGVLYRNGKQFDASWDHGQPLSFQLGNGMVIPGWDRGVPGMRVGGRRELIIPASLAYGAQGSPPKIGPNEPLVFVIDLLSAQ
jgi:peptidylprolyl isomerase